ncbi:MAG: sigma-70 family RNA polymerase sigma factor [Bryobacteraceae bacterium]
MGENTCTRERSDSELIERLCKRDERALAFTYDRYSRVIYSLLVRITRNPSLAEDLLQEVFMRVWTHAHVFVPSKGSLAVWMLSIARNMAIDHARSAEARFIVRLRSIENLDFLCCAGNSGTRNSVIESVVVAAAFSNLPSNQQRALELAYFEGYSQSEIAARLHEPLGTVKSWMRSGLSRMRKTINATPETCLEMPNVERTSHGSPSKILPPTMTSSSITAKA